MNTALISPFTALSLKLVGLIFILAFFVDSITLAIPLQLLDSQWQLSYVNTIVDRGIIPLLGIVLMILGYWIDATVVSSNKSAKKKGIDLRLGIFILASVLGLFFLLLVPLHLNNLRMQSADVIEQIQAGSDEAETRIQQQYEQLEALAQDPSRLQQLNQNITAINQALSSGQWQGRQINAEQRLQLQQQQQQFQALQQYAQNPQELQARLDELTTQLRSQRMERENTAKLQIFKQGFRIGLSSLMLSIGYIIIGWGGLKGMTTSQGKKTPSKVPQ